MIIEEQDILRHINTVTGVLHVGAHEAQELGFYRRHFGNVPIHWIEADPKVIPRLAEAIKGDPNSSYNNCCVADVDGEERTFHRANMDQSSSLLELGTHKTAHPEVEFVDEFKVITATLDSILEIWEKMETLNFLNMDVQGAEGLVLKGAHNYLQYVDYIYTEVNRDELYEGCITIPEMDELLAGYGFERREILVYDGFGWGDALYVKEKS